MINRLEGIILRRKATKKLRSIVVADLDSKIDFSSNDYLGLSRNRNLAAVISAEYDEFMKSQSLKFPVQGEWTNCNVNDTI